MKNNIKLERARNNFTQADLAKLAKVSRQTINAMELGKYAPSVILALRLSDIFDVSVNDLFQIGQEDWE